METPDFAELGETSGNSPEEWEAAWDIIEIQEAWPIVVGLVLKLGYMPQDAAIQLNILSDSSTDTEGD